MKRLLTLLTVLLPLAIWCAAPVVTNVTASQRDDGSMMVDVYYDVYDADGDVMTVSLQASLNNGANWNLSCNLVSGDVGYGIYNGSQRHIVWNIASEHPNLSGDDFRFKVIADDGAGMNVAQVPLPAGSFDMGRTNVATPIHTVNLDAFHMGQYEVTHEEYILFMNDAGIDPNGNSANNQLVDMSSSYCAVGYANGQFYFDGSSNATDPQCPMIEVTWYGAVEYCNWLSQREGRTPCYTINGASVTCDWNANGYRLPTEAEWEYSARGATNTPDYTYSGSNNIGEVAWYNSNSGGHTHPVGEKLANGIGTYDQSGNVWEWCWDWYSSSYYGSSPADNPTGPSSGSTRVLRGGGWSYSASYCGVAYRGNSSPSNSGDNIGFRLCRTAE